MIGSLLTVSCSSDGHTASTPLLHGTMVVFLDLNEDDVSDPDPHVDPTGSEGYDWALRQRVSKPREVTAASENNIFEDEERINPNINSLSAALGCYPYI